DQAGSGQHLYIRVNVAVIAPQRLGEGPHAADLVAVHITQQLHALDGQQPGQRIPALKHKMPLAKLFAPLGTVPGLDKASGGIMLNIAAHGDLDIAHFSPRRVRTSDQKSAISCSTLMNSYCASTPRK